MPMVPRNHTHDTLAAAASLDPSVLGKLLRGDRPLHLIHLAALERALGTLRPTSYEMSDLPRKPLRGRTPPFVTHQNNVILPVSQRVLRDVSTRPAPVTGSLCE